MKVRERSRGFTLIELMIVVAIVGVLAALGLYGVRRYVLEAKTAEARVVLGQMAKDATTSYARESMSPHILGPANVTQVVNSLCTTATSSIPSTITLVKGGKYQSAPSEWAADSGTLGRGFSCLRFTLSDPQYYMYTYDATSGSAGTFTVTANGDLDGNGTTSTFQLSGSVYSGTVFVSPGFEEISPGE